MQKVLTIIGSMAFLVVGFLPQGVPAALEAASVEHVLVTCKQVGNGQWLLDTMDPQPAGHVPETCIGAIAYVVEPPVLTEALVAERRECRQLSHTALRAEERRIWHFFRRRTMTVRRALHVFICDDRRSF